MKYYELKVYYARLILDKNLKLCRRWCFVPELSITDTTLKEILRVCRVYLSEDRLTAKTNLYKYTIKCIMKGGRKRG